MSDRRILFVLPFVLMAIPGCSVTPLNPLPKGWIFAQDYSATEAVPLDGKNQPVEASAIAILRSGSFTMAIMPVGSGTAPDIQRIDLKSVRYFPESEHSTSASGRQLFAVSANFKVDYIVGASASTAYKYVLEYTITPTSPHYRMTYVLDPRELLRLQEHLGTNAYVLFQREHFAPDRFSQYELLDTGAKVTALTVLDVGASSNVTTTVTYDRRFVLRKYARSDIVEAFLGFSPDPGAGTALYNEIASLVARSGREPMFVPAPEGTDFSTGDCVSPFLLRFYDGPTRYRCSFAYACHLNAEGVLFDCSLPDLAEAPDANVRGQLAACGFKADDFARLTAQSIDYRLTSPFVPLRRRIKSDTAVCLEVACVNTANSQRRIQRIELEPPEKGEPEVCSIIAKTRSGSLEPPLVLGERDDGRLTVLRPLKDSLYYEYLIDPFYTAVIVIDLSTDAPAPFSEEGFLLFQVRNDYRMRTLDAPARPATTHIRVFTCVDRSWHPQYPAMKILDVFTPINARATPRNLGLESILKPDRVTKHLSTADPNFDLFYKVLERSSAAKRVALEEIARDKTLAVGSAVAEVDPALVSALVTREEFAKYCKRWSIVLVDCQDARSDVLVLGQLAASAK